MRAIPLPYGIAAIVLTTAILMTGALLSGAALAQPAPSLTLATHPTLGPYVADPAGMSLYLLRDRSEGRDDRGGGRDDEQPGVCDGECLAVWPPYVLSGTPTVGPGLDQALVDIITRADGLVQITYGGWPLYYYSADAAPGDVLGHDVDDAWGDWYLVSPEGEDVED
jgi:predicted lipoprotein with Yx(FWY)xxD motif